MRQSDCVDKLKSMINLTPKEKEFIHLKRQGLKMVDIAQLMFMSERSIFTFANNLYQKTGTYNGSNLIDWAYQKGYLKINAETLGSKEDEAA
jgi:DNA-binding NarL/FixJ family response regulator